MKPRRHFLILSDKYDSICMSSLGYTKTSVPMDYCEYCKDFTSPVVDLSRIEFNILSGEDYDIDTLVTICGKCIRKTILKKLLPYIRPAYVILVPEKDLNKILNLKIGIEPSYIKGA